MELSQELYKAGLGDFLGVLDAERSVLELELAMADSRASAAGPIGASIQSACRRLAAIAFSDWVSLHQWQ